MRQEQLELVQLTMSWQRVFFQFRENCYVWLQNTWSYWAFTKWHWHCEGCFQGLAAHQVAWCSGLILIFFSSVREVEVYWTDWILARSKLHLSGCPGNSCHCSYWWFRFVIQTRLQSQYYFVFSHSFVLYVYLFKQKSTNSTAITAIATTIYIPWWRNWSVKVVC